jgi:polar amino acid transport system permease protein
VLANLSVELLKSTALVSLIGLADLTFEGRILRDQTLASFPVFGLVLVLYFAVTSLLSAGARRLEHRLGAYRGGRA